AYASVDFGATPATQFVARVASAAAGVTTGNVVVHVDGTSSQAVASPVIGNTGGYQSWVTRTTNISPTTGTHSVYLVFTSASTGRSEERRVGKDSSSARGSSAGGKK